MSEIPVPHEISENETGPFGLTWKEIDNPQIVIDAIEPIIAKRMPHLSFKELTDIDKLLELTRKNLSAKPNPALTERFLKLYNLINTDEETKR